MEWSIKKSQIYLTTEMINHTNLEQKIGWWSTMALITLLLLNQVYIETVMEFLLSYIKTLIHCRVLT